MYCMEAHVHVYFDYRDIVANNCILFTICHVYKHCDSQIWNAYIFNLEYMYKVYMGRICLIDLNCNRFKEHFDRYILCKPKSCIDIRST